MSQLVMFGDPTSEETSLAHVKAQAFQAPVSAEKINKIEYVYIMKKKKSWDGISYYLRPTIGVALQTLHLF